MKIKKIFLMPILGCLSSVAFVSCDGGSDTNNSVNLQIPDPSATTDTGGTNNDPSQNPTTSLEDQYADQLFNKINEVRTSRGLPALVRDTSIDGLCNDHNIGMVNRSTPGGALSSDHDNVQARADVLFAAGFISYGENTAVIRGYASSVVTNEFTEGWVTSPGHFANIIGNYTHTGIAVNVDARDGSVFATQIFTR
jgi:uncharacterized protein YkwD